MGILQAERRQGVRLIPLRRQFNLLAGGPDLIDLTHDSDNVVDMTHDSDNVVDMTHDSDNVVDMTQEAPKEKGKEKGKGKGKGKAKKNGKGKGKAKAKGKGKGKGKAKEVRVGKLHPGTVVEPGVEIEYVPSHLVADPRNFQTAIVVSVYPYPDDPDDVEQLVQPALRVVGDDTVSWDQQIRVNKTAAGKQPEEYEEFFTEVLDRSVRPGTIQVEDERVSALKATRDLVRQHVAAF